MGNLADVLYVTSLLHQASNRMKFRCFNEFTQSKGNTWIFWLNFFFSLWIASKKCLPGAGAQCSYTNPYPLYVRCYLSWNLPHFTNINGQHIHMSTRAICSCQIKHTECFNILHHIGRPAITNTVHVVLCFSARLVHTVYRCSHYTLYDQLKYRSFVHYTATHITHYVMYL